MWEIYALTNHSSLYVEAAKWDKAYNFPIKAVALGREADDVALQASSYAKAGLALAYQSKFKEATVLIKASILSADSSAQPFIISEANDAMAHACVMQKKYTEAIPYFEKDFEV